MQRQWKALGSYGTVGLEFALSVIVGLVFGDWVDGKLGTGPWLAITGLLLGVIAGYRSLWRTLKRATREAEKAEEAEQKARKDYLDRGPDRDDRDE